MHANGFYFETNDFSRRDGAMLNQQVLAGRWNEISGKLKEKWGTLSDDDVRAFNGNVEQLVGRVQHITGESREAIEKFLGQIADEGSHVAAGIRDAMGARAAQFVETAHDGYDAVRQRYSDAGKVVQEHPGQSIAVSFGLGLLAGLGLALALRKGASESAFSKGRAASEHYGRQMFDALAAMMPEPLRKGR